MKFVTIVLVLLAFLCPVAQADVSASRVRPVARKLEEHIADLAETPEEAKELKALLPLKYSVVEDEEINAAAQRTRNTIIVNRGVLLLVQNDDELAFVIAHEIGHILVGQMKKVELEEALEKLSQESGGAIKNEQMADELMADVIGVMLMHKAGFDSDASVKFFRHLIAERGTLVWAALYLKGTSTLDDVHLIEEARLQVVSAIAEKLRDDGMESKQEEQETVYIWIGIFNVTYEGADAKRQTVETTDLLGLYSEHDFRSAQTMEVEARKQIIQKFAPKQYPKQILRVLDVELKEIVREQFEAKKEREKWSSKAAPTP